MGSRLWGAPPFPTAELGGELRSPDRLVGSGMGRGFKAALCQHPSAMRGSGISSGGEFLIS